MRKSMYKLYNHKILKDPRLEILDIGSRCVVKTNMQISFSVIYLSVFVNTKSKVFFSQS